MKITSHNLFGFLRPLVELGLASLSLAAGVYGQIVPPAGSVEYQNQNSATSFYHSGIVTSTGIVWDNQFAQMVNNSLPNKIIGPISVQGYREIAFAFMECYGGGMIDEFLNKNLSPASYTSAARWNETAWAYDPAALGVAANYESTYNRPYAPAAGGATPQTQLGAATVGRDGDILGPIINIRPPFIEHPQFTSSGPVGSSITLHNNNPSGGMGGNTNYLAVVFGGSTAEVANTNSVNRIRNSLVAAGYTPAQIDVIAPGGSAAQLAAAWTWVKNNTTPSTQVYYWNSWGHGSLTFDLFGFLKSQFANLQKNLTYSFNIASDFLSQLNRLSQLNGANTLSPFDSPYFEIDSTSLVSDLSIDLDGHTLHPFDVNDLWGDGTEYQYRFLLGNLASLGLSDSGDTLSFDYSGADGSLEFGGLNSGYLANDPSPTPVPEVSTYGICGSVLLLGIMVRRRRHVAAG